MTTDQKKAHRVIEHSLEILETVCQRFTKEKAVDPISIEQVIDVLQTLQIRVITVKNKSCRLQP